MIEHFFGSGQNLLLILLSLLFRVLRSIHDGLSDRAKFFYSRPYAQFLYGEVGAWPWHIINWLGRDLFIGFLYVYLLYEKQCPWQTLFTATLLNWFLHDFFYWWTVSHRHLFHWGFNWPKLPSLFRHIFKPEIDEQRRH